MTEPYFNEPDVLKFQILLEEVTRAKPSSPGTRFVPPDNQSLERLKSKFHHVLYGRRGTGKSSILRRVQSELQDSKKLVAWADQETFSGLSYPDVLVGALAEIFRQFAEQAEKAVPDGKWRERRRKRAANAELAALLRQAVLQLHSLKSAPSESEIAWRATTSESSASASEKVGQIAVGGKRAKLVLSGKNAKLGAVSRGDEIEQRFTASKREHLERAVSTYRDLMLAVSELHPDSYVILDDFYRLNEEDQPGIAGYFHRVVKDTSVWLKFGSIPFWTKLYAGGSPAVGLQVPHDLREVSLDRGLPDFPSSKRFLESILSELAKEFDVNLSKLLSDGAKDRLILASGAVPRDYIGLVGDAITFARNRGVSAKVGTERVIAEDVNEAAGRTAKQKLDDLDEDAGEHAHKLRNLVIEITSHCRNTGSACFLIDAGDQALVQDLGRLQNMRFVHLIDSNESLPDHQSSRYIVYLLDVSQLAAQRAWRVDFMGWTNRQKRRARRLIFPVTSQPRPAKKSRPGKMSVNENIEQTVDETQTLDIQIEEVEERQSDESAIVGDVDAPISTDPAVVEPQTIS